mmetsp:Transcript_6897/g.6153  ORF Transcript_6897/g.6153 Transcript_6897/m.6153 type:complete len:266 (-) Transcript_6897:25-822(-)
MPTTTATTDDNKLHSAILKIKKSGSVFKSKCYTFCMNDKEIFKANSSSLNIFKTGSFHIETTDIEALSIGYYNTDNNNNDNESRWKQVGYMTSPGLLFEKSVVYNYKKEINTKIIYKNTSRSGELMELKAFIPEIVSISNEKKLIKTISDLTFLPNDCSKIIVEYCQLYWINNNKFISLQNKLPKWNENINAYTLEFGGRALIPSVHNFQLIKTQNDNNDNNIILQLGKRTNNPPSFNIDYSFPLSPYQAFSICLSVLDRSFVWD